jgi:tetratricopeptide (TPR) repeat protein
LVVAAATVAYANSFLGTFQFDDIPSILENPTVRQLWPLTIPLQPPAGGLTVSGRPVLNFSLALNYAVSAGNPWSYHALNLLIHIGVALALFGIVRRTLARIDAPHPLTTSLAVALIWAVHPLTTEAVTYIVQRAESLMALFYLLTMYCFIRATAETHPRRRLVWQAMSVVTCWLGMGTKEVMVSVPVAVLLYDRLFVAGNWSGAWRSRRTLYLLLAAGWLPLLWFVAGTGWDRGGTFGAGVSWSAYWLSQGEALARYAGLAFWPSPLTLDYGLPTASPVAAYVFSAMILVALAFTAAGFLRGRSWAFLPAFGFMVLAPTSLMPGILQFATEHRMYLPLTVVVAAAVLGVRRAVAQSGLTETDQRRGLSVALVLVVLALGTATAARNRIYADELSLWLDTATKRPGSALAEANVGKALLDRGRIAEGLTYCLKSVALDPTKPTARYNLGLAYEAQERWTEALAEFIAVAKVNPHHYLAQYRAGRLLDRLGRALEAEEFLHRALALEPEWAEARASLGVALSLQGREAEAVEEFTHALRLQADQPEEEFDLGVSLARLRHPGEAESHYRAAVRLRPDYGNAWLNLGVTLAQLGRLAQALPALRSATQLMPESPEAHENLATLLDLTGSSTEAIAEYRNALRLRPDYAEAHYNLGNALFYARNQVAARAEYAEAVRLRPDFVAAREMLARLPNLPAGP